MEIKHKLTNEVLLTIEGANLQWADLRGANLREANLQRANLQRADLRGADLQRADLREANLQRADLRGADLTTDVIRIDGMRWDVTILHGWMRIGCQHHYVDVWDKFTDNKISKMDEHALEFWQANKQKLITIANFTKE